MKLWHEGAHLRVLSEYSVSYQMNTNMTVFRWFTHLCVLVLWIENVKHIVGQKEIQPGKYLMEKGQSEHYLQLSFKCFVKLFAIIKSLS